VSDQLPTGESFSYIEWTPLCRVPRLEYAIGDPGSAGRRVRATSVVAPAGWPDTAVDAVSLDGLELRAASVRGLLHRSRHTPRQDAFSLGTSNDPLVLTVCDGVGSLGRSHLAAQYVVAQLPELVAQHARDDAVDWEAIFQPLSDALSAIEAGGEGSKPTDRADRLATTVTCAVLRREPSGLTAELAWVGDSPAYVLRQNHWRLITAAKSVGEGGIATTVVSAIPSSHVTFDTAHVELLPGDLFVVMSDGISDPLGGGTGLVGGALEEWWAEPVSALEFAAHVGFKRKGFFDDRTAIAVWVLPARTEPASETEEMPEAATGTACEGGTEDAHAVD
jgi:serine/threonine protein phosphatase PrpC